MELRLGPSEADIAVEDVARLQSLLEADLVENIDLEDDLVFPIPEGVAIRGVVRGYDTRDTTKLKVRCGACRSHQPHNRGFRVELESGHFARIGHDCGEKQFGKGAWEHALADFVRREDHAHYISRIKPAVETISKIVPLINEWHLRAKVIASWKSELLREFPELYAQLVKQAKERSGALEKEKWGREKFVDRTGNERTRKAVVIATMGRIPYPQMFLGFTLSATLSSAKNELLNAVALFENKQDSKSLTRAFSHMSKSRQLLNDAEEAHQGALLNVQTGWLADMCDWANQHYDLEATYHFDHRVLSGDERGRQRRVEFPLPSQIGQPLIAKIVEVWS